MARFRKNDFFKWAQKIKSVFCFNPHTHEGSDVRLVVVCLLPEVSIHTPTKGVTGEHGDVLDFLQFQSTHPRRV